MGDEEPRHFSGRGSFKVSGEAATATEPCEGSFDYPAPRQKLEAFDPVRSLNDFDRPRTTMGERAGKLRATINPVSKDVAQLGKAMPYALQQGDRTVDILNVGGMNVNGQQQPVGIGDDVPLAPVNAFAGIETAWTARLGGRSGLAVDDCSCRFWFASESATGLPHQSSYNAVPSACIAPSIKIALHRRVRRELPWQGPPLAAGGQNEQNSFYDLAQINLPRSAQSMSRRHPPHDQLPFRIGHVACIAQPVTQILGTSDFSPRHGALPRIFANPKESQPAEITHPFFGQALRSGLLAASRRMKGPTWASWFETAAEFIIGPRFARTRWRLLTVRAARLLRSPEIRAPRENG